MFGIPALSPILASHFSPSHKTILDLVNYDEKTTTVKSMKKIWSSLSTLKKVLVVVVSFFVVSGILGSLFGQETTTPTPSSSESTIAKTTPATVAPSPESALRKFVEKEAGNSTNLDGYTGRIKSLDVSGEQVLIDMHGSENLTDGMVKSANRRLVLNAITAYQKSGLTASEIFISVWYPLTDNLGNTTLRRVLSYGFSAAQISKINAENVDTKNMDTNFADISTGIYPAFRW